MENNKKKTNQLFFSYLIYPNIKFETYEEGEKIIFLLRAHPFTQIKSILDIFLFTILLIFFNFFLPQFLNFNQIFVFNFFCLAFIFSFFWINFVNWYFNVGILTNRRLIDIDFNGVLYREITTARLDKIEDITIKGAGYFGSIFDFGSIYVQTAGMENYIEFHDIPHPSFIVSEINKLLNKKNG
ncbi:MAG: PH domain-containing protein [Patescibacteria group bacterium]|nr:PH domain-containing protein [Patescibacteria group bacterium]